MFQNTLKELRNSKGLLQKDIALFLGITTSAYGFYEQGKRDPDTATLVKIAQYFNVSIDYLLGCENPSPTPKPIEISNEDIELLQQIKKASADKQKAIELILNIEEKSIASGK